MINSTTAVPSKILSALLAGFVAGAAARTLQSATVTGRPPVLHPGDQFGHVLAWTWEHDRDQAMQLLADYLAELRVHGPGASTVDPPYQLVDVLTGVRFALPDNFPDYELLVECARRDVPALYGDPTI